MFHIANPERFRGQTLGNGHCVRGLQVASNGAIPHTSAWRRGVRVRGGNVPANTAIATFGGDPPHYTNSTNGSSHAAILVAEEAGGLRVWDQWVGNPWSQRLIRFRGGEGRKVNDGDQFFTIVT